MLIPVELYQIVITDNAETQVIVLKEKGGERQLPIFIGANEARAIERKLKDIPIQRPLTHDLAADIIAKLGGRIARVVVNDLREETYYAFIEVMQGVDPIRIDARPSDAVAIAVRGPAPIFVEDVVFERTHKPDLSKL
jgi:bifunctional DNase/RNase